MAFESTPHSTEYLASAYALHGADTAMSRDDHRASCNDDVESLRLQASRLEHLLQVMPAGVIVIDGKGIVRQANEQAKALLGEPLEEEVWRRIITRSFKPRADDGHEVSLVDGRRVKLSITPLENEPGQLIVITDLTETRQLQARVSHMQRLSSLGKMVASLAHQIRTPLSAAMLYASNLTRKGLGQEAQEQFANKLTDRLKELESQVNDMLLFAKSGEEQVVSNITLSELLTSVEGSAQTMTVQAHQTLGFSGFEQEVSITGNLTALQGALLNLIHNASQVTPKGELVAVDASVSGNRLNIAVTDKGPGVPEGLKHKIFEPFFTTKNNGTGLGLAVVKSVVNAHNGTLSVFNTPEGGACFSVSLPCKASTQSSHTLTHVA
ncbi:PAS domain-containing protein [Alteromonas mediterranea]|uniref:histidine kinase n=1 Tax=Alteromonas mediterranea 615 TaxID=1300253 RepID=S5AKX3_9ALTE|nr:ATP-binding protein [Alteromonas mediterranea]AGP77308.1 sensory box sensor histidine kinase in two-component regulatory system [Alteromonas mediterranea 615]AGP92798.1 sensory box sensor histidine kinase in two-component regulatory system [Alteromonas mediterranea U8]AGP84812.1 sensory box sensor histidine kinase in two-component regulatory system [Alteromonas mediterranea U4]AGP88944.1 sensory box sensor histidine kinase in two-component regulatory system [Alteromonas mediterranea U7]QDG3